MNTQYNQVASLILKSLRSENGLKIEDVEEISTINKGTISRYENNPKVITFDILEKILNVYDVTLTIFFDKCNVKMQKSEEKGE